jgi:hypothetical protein
MRVSYKRLPDERVIVRAMTHFSGGNKHSFPAPHAVDPDHASIGPWACIDPAHESSPTPSWDSVMPLTQQRNAHHHGGFAIGTIVRTAIMTICTLAGPAFAQDFTLLVDPCRDCRLILKPVTRLGVADGLGALVGAASSVSVGANGNYYVTDFMNHTSISVYSSRGTPLRRLGRGGEGPGEYRGIDIASVASDTLFVFDGSNRRMTVLDLTGKLVRSVMLPFPSVFQAQRVGSDRFVLAGAIPTRDLAGLPLHLFHTVSGLGRSFGDDTPTVRPGHPHLNMRAIAASTNGRVWSVKHTAYEAELWNTTITPNLEMRLRRQADWFKAYVERPLGTGEPPGPWIMAVNEFRSGYLAVLIAVAADNYSEVLGPKVLQAGRMTYDYDREKTLFDTIVEVIDIRRRSVILSTRVDDYLTGFVSGKQQVYAANHIDGVPVIDVFDFTFTSGR